MSKINIPAGWKLVPMEPTLEMGWAYLEAARKTSQHTDHAFNHPGYRAAIAIAPTPPVDAVLGEPVAESAGAWKSRLMTEACSKWSGAQKIEAGDIIEWIADFRVQTAPVASRTVQAEPVALNRLLQSVEFADEALWAIATKWRMFGDTMEPIHNIGKAAALARAAHDRLRPAIAAYEDAERTITAPAATAEPGLSFCGGGNPPIAKFETPTLEWEDEHAGAGAASLAPREDTRLLDWLESKWVRSTRGDFMNPPVMDCHFTHYWPGKILATKPTLREAIRAAIAASPAGAEGEEI